MILDIGGDDDRLYLLQRIDTMLLAPREELRMASAYAYRVFLFRIVAAKNSMKRQAAASPARPNRGR
jgi:hypothetical protein